LHQRKNVNARESTQFGARQCEVPRIIVVSTATMEILSRELGTLVVRTAKEASG